MSFIEILLKAKEGDSIAVKQLFEMYKPLLLKEALHNGIFEEDLHQELCLTLIDCIQKFDL